jgi:hypothetical protein
VGGGRRLKHAKLDKSCIPGKGVLKDGQFLKDVPQNVVGRAAFKFCMGDKLWEEMEGVKRDETFFRAL